MSFQLISPSFQHNGQFPADYTCNGRNINPPLSISDVPAGAASLVLVFDDPDAAKEPAGNGATFDHWVLYDIPPKDQEIVEDSTPIGAKQGKNSMGTGIYIGPCPPTFRHEYSFRLFALDKELALPGTPTKTEVEKAMEGHVMAEVKLVAYYEQPERKLT